MADFGTSQYRRRELADARVTDLEAARDKGKAWLAIDSAGKDPATVVAAEKRKEARERANTFESVAEDFLSEWVIGKDPAKPLQRKWKEVKRHVGILSAKWESVRSMRSTVMSL